MKRKDSKGRNLRMGEGQRKNGLYYYQCTDEYGNRVTITSWRLVASDPVPKGKRECIPLRNQEEDILSKARAKVDLGTKCTVIEAAEKYRDSRIGLKPGSMECIDIFIRVLRKYRLCEMQIYNVEVKDVKNFCRQMYKDGYAVSTIQNYKGKMYSVFSFAMDELHLMTRNPADFKIKDVINASPNKRRSLTETEKQELVMFLEEDNISHKYFDEINVLLGTGLRIAEFVGLTEDNIDFKNHCIMVDHQTQREQRLWMTPKSESGIRAVYFSDEVEESIRRLVAKAAQRRTGPFCADGKKYIVIDKNGNPRASYSMRYILKSIQDRYCRKTGKELPSISPHVLRHTYCTDQAEAGVNMVALQYMMGHTDISTTNRYLHTNQDIAAKEANRIYRNAASDFSSNFSSSDSENT